MEKFDRRKARALLPSRGKSQNKSHGGRSLIIAGSPGYLGASVLAAKAAARSGSGYTILLCNHNTVQPLKNPDFLTAEASPTRLTKIHFDSVGIGPGLGVGTKTEAFIKRLFKMKVPSVVLDADALTVLSKKPSLALAPSWILTPHEGELSRLLKVPTQKLIKARSEYAELAAKRFGCIVLLKGSPTLICDGRHTVKIESGNPALAKAGTGDVLTGLITGFLAQGLHPMEAASLGAFVHGLAADLWVKSGRDHLSLLASDLLEWVPIALAQLRKGLK